MRDSAFRGASYYTRRARSNEEIDQSTFVVTLRAGSPALGTGDSAICQAAPVNNLDQRGALRIAGGDSACLTAAKGSLAIKRDPLGGKHKLKWQWQKGDAALDPNGLLSPLAGQNAYNFCLYDQTAGIPELKMATTISNIDLCGSRGCWTKSRKGWGYKGDYNADGISQLGIKGGDAGKPMVKVQGKGSNLAIPDAVSSAALFNQESTVIVELRDAATCWTSSFAVSGTKQNLPDSFKAKAP